MFAPVREDSFAAERPMSSLRFASRPSMSRACIVPTRPSTSTAAVRAALVAFGSSRWRMTTSVVTAGLPAVSASSRIDRPRSPVTVIASAASAATSGGARIGRRHAVISSS